MGQEPQGKPQGGPEDYAVGQPVMQPAGTGYPAPGMAMN